MDVWVTVDLFERDSGPDESGDTPVDDKINLLAIDGEIKKELNRYKVSFCDGTCGYLCDADYERVESALKTMHEHSDEAEARGHREHADLGDGTDEA